MKKIASFLLLLIAFTSCSEDITKGASFQALKDDVLWHAKDARATIGTNGALTITALTPYETVTLKTTSANPGTYALGVNNNNAASYVFARDGEELTFQTGAGVGDGEIEITEYDTAKMTVTGTFRFNAENVENNPAGGEILNFHEGNFYKVRVIPSL